MKSNMYAIFNGKEYSASNRTDGSIILRSSDEKDVDSGFQIHKGANSNVKAIKYVMRSQVEELYKKNRVAIYKGYEFWVVEEDEESILISATNLDYNICNQLEMTCVDKGIYQKRVGKKETQIRTVKEIIK